MLVSASHHRLASTVLCDSRDTKYRKRPFAITIPSSTSLPFCEMEIQWSDCAFLQEMCDGKRFQFVRRISKSLYGAVFEATWINTIDNSETKVCIKVSRLGLPPHHSIGSDSSRNARREAAMHRWIQKIRDHLDPQLQSLKGKRDSELKEIKAFCKKMYPSVDQDVLLDVLIGSQFISAYYDEREDENYHYLITEFADSDMFTYLVDQNGFENNHALLKTVLIQVTQALLFLQSSGIAFVDLSLENICLKKKYGSSDLEVRLIDFGLSQAFPAFSESNEKLASHFPSHMFTDLSLNPKQFKCNPVQSWDGEAHLGKKMYNSPELFGLESWDAFANDAWALGILMFVSFTRNPPFAEPRLGDAWFNLIYSGLWLESVKQKDQVAARHAFGKIPPDWLCFIDSILKSEEKRPMICEILRRMRDMF